jgi:hypothetical protein
VERSRGDNLPHERPFHRSLPLGVIITKHSNLTFLLRQVELLQQLSNMRVNILLETRPGMTRAVTSSSDRSMPSDQRGEYNIEYHTRKQTGAYTQDPN